MSILYKNMNITQVLRFDQPIADKDWTVVAENFEKAHLPWIIHAANCPDVTCQKGDCLKFKCMFTHFKLCPNKKTCDYCQVTANMYRWHASKCIDCNCKVPWCHQFNEVFCVESLIELKNFVSSPKRKRSNIKNIKPKKGKEN